MQIGIVGFPLSGKTTLFNALTGQHEATGFQAGAKDKHVAVVKVPDLRLDQLHSLVPQARKVQTTIEYLDMVGVEKGSGKAGFDNQFLGDLRSTAALIWPPCRTIFCCRIWRLWKIGSNGWPNKSRRSRTTRRKKN